MYDCGLCSVRKLFDQWKLLPSTVLCVCKVTKRGRIMLCCNRWHEAADFPPPILVSGSFMIFNCWWVGNQQQKIFLFLLGIYLDLKKKMLPHCLISSWLNDKSMKKKLLCEGEGKQHHGTLYCLYQGRKCKWLLTSHWRDRSKWLLWGNWGNMGFFFPFLPLVQSCCMCGTLHDCPPLGMGTDIMYIFILEFGHLTQNSAKQRRDQFFYKRMGVLIESSKSQRF